MGHFRNIEVWYKDSNEFYDSNGKQDKYYNQIRQILLELGKKYTNCFASGANLRTNVERKEADDLDLPMYRFSLESLEEDIAIKCSDEFLYELVKLNWVGKISSRRVKPDSKMNIEAIIEAIIDTYKGKLRKDPIDATSFILRELQGKLGDKLGEKYLGTFMCGDEGDGYAPIQENMLYVDIQDGDATFKPSDNQFVLFEIKDLFTVKNKESYNNPDYDKRGIMPYTFELQVVGGTNEVLNAHVYYPSKTSELIWEKYLGQVTSAFLAAGKAKFLGIQKS